MNRSSGAALEALISRLEVRSRTSFTFDGEELHLGVARRGEPAQNPLSRLTDVLYNHWFCRPRGGTGAAPAADLTTFFAGLSAANASRDGLDHDWRIDRSLPDGSVEASKGRLNRTLQPGEFLRSGERWIDGRPAAAVWLPRGSAMAQPGFYYAYGETPPAVPDNENLLRFYWNVPAHRAAALLASLTTALNRFRVPFRFKCPVDPRLYDRQDAAVLYVEQSRFAVVARLVQRIAESAGPLEASVPPLALELHPGVGFAEDPGLGISFGRHRCHLLAEGLLGPDFAAARSGSERLEALRRHLVARGHDPDRLWLRPGSRYPYEPLLRPVPGPPVARTPDGPLAAADRIGAELCRDALPDGSGGATWLAARAEILPTGWGESYGAIGANLYSGCAGVGLFLTRLYRATGEPLHAAVAAEALSAAVRFCSQMGADSFTGLYSGRAGIAVAALEAGSVLESSALEGGGLEILESLEPKAESPLGRDLMSGSAGAILALLQTARDRRRDALTELAVRHGDALLENAESSGGGLAWQTNPTPGPPSSGLSHGAAGIAVALAELAAATGESRYRDAAFGALAFVESDFDAAFGNWPDRASAPEAAPVDVTAWCHGAPGIALAFLRCFELFGEAGHREQAAKAIGITAERTSSGLLQQQAGMCLCHGLTGNSEVLAEAARILEQPELAETSQRVARLGVERYLDRRSPWPCGLPSGPTEVPGLMQGTAGIGHFYLRLAQPETPLILLPKIA